MIETKKHGHKVFPQSLFFDWEVNGLYFDFLDLLFSLFFPFYSYKSSTLRTIMLPCTIKLRPMQYLTFSSFVGAATNILLLSYACLITHLSFYLPPVKKKQAVNCLCSLLFTFFYYLAAVFIQRCCISHCNF